MRWLYLVSVCLHVSAGMTWVGGMVLFVVAMMPWVRRLDPQHRASFLSAFGKRFRIVAWTCYGVLASTGAFNLWVRGIRASDFLSPEWRSSTFGSILILKIALFLLAVAVTTLHESEAVRRQAKWLGRLSLVLGLIIVALAVVLVRL
jgi:putative copper export protein